MATRGGSSKSGSSSSTAKPGASSSGKPSVAPPTQGPPAAPPPTGQPPAAGTPGPKNDLLSRYNAYKTAIRWIMLVLALNAVAYGIVAAWSERAPQSAMIIGKLGPAMTTNGRSIALTLEKDHLTEMLISNDSGKSFEEINELGLRADSELLLTFAPDSQTVLVLERYGILHIKAPGDDKFRAFALGGGGGYTSIAFLPGTDSFYIYGGSEMIIGMSWKTPGRQSNIVAPVPVQMLAFDSSKHAVVISADSGLFGNLIYQGTSVRALSHKTTFDEKVKTSLFGVAPRQILYGSLRYVPQRKKFVVRFFIQGGENGMLYFDDRNDYSLELFSRNAVFPFGYSIWAADGSIFYYGNSPYIWRDSTITDTVPSRGEISSLRLVGNSLALALVSNSGSNYLYQKKGGRWVLNPALIKSTFQIKGLSGKLVIGTLLILCLALILALAICQILAVQYSRRIKPAIAVNELLTKPERPLGLQDDDLLGFAAVEDAITRIIRNPSLDLPMTIVVSGTWGSGKSSMMNRIRGGLQETPALRKRFMTTWFNAWHLQGESSLLNAFLLNIIASYEKFYSSLTPFRMRIFSARFLRLPFWKKFGFGFAIFLLAPFFILVVLKMLDIPGIRDRSWIDSWCTMITNIFAPDQGWSFHVLTPVGAGVIIIFSLLFLNRQFIPTGLSAFFELLPRNNFKLDVEQADIGSREKFRQQYWEIMDAARKGTRLVVFIDDLDRIPGDKVLELLEGINFISDAASRPPDAASAAPNTIFVLGMYTQEVARLVGTQLQKVNNATLPVEVLGTLYIEKMVQLIVPVPFDTDNKEKLKKLYEN